MSSGSLRPVVAAVVGAVGASNLPENLKPTWPALREALMMVAPASVPMAVGPSAMELQTAALTASIQAMNKLIAAQQQGSGASLWRLAMWLAPPAAAAYAIRHYGWRRVGWVTGEQLQQGMESVRTAVSAMVDALGEALHARFQRVDEILAETAQTLHEVFVSTGEVKAEVHAVGESLRSLEARMAPIEANSATAAQGVEVLCELVKTSGLLANASGESLRRLDHFTGKGSSSPAPERNDLLSPPKLPAPMPLPSPIEATVSGSMLRALMEPPTRLSAA